MKSRNHGWRGLSVGKVASSRTRSLNLFGSARRRGRDLSLLMTTIEGVHGVFYRIAAPFPLSELEPVIERFFKAETCSDEEEPC